MNAKPARIEEGKRRINCDCEEEVATCNSCGKFIALGENHISITIQQQKYIEVYSQSGKELSITVDNSDELSSWCMNCWREMKERYL